MGEKNTYRKASFQKNTYIPEKLVLREATTLGRAVPFGTGKKPNSPEGVRIQAGISGQKGTNITVGKVGEMRVEATLQGRVGANETSIEHIQVEAGRLNAKPPGELSQHFAVSMEFVV